MVTSLVVCAETVTGVERVMVFLVRVTFSMTVVFFFLWAGGWSALFLSTHEQRWCTSSTARPSSWRIVGIPYSCSCSFTGRFCCWSWSWRSRILLSSAAGMAPAPLPLARGEGRGASCWVGSSLLRGKRLAAGSRWRAPLTVSGQFPVMRCSVSNTVLRRKCDQKWLGSYR